MRIHIRELTDKLSLTLTGEEAWLERIHRDYPLLGAEGVRPKLNGTLAVEREMAGSVLVEGHLSFAPFIPCARCDHGVAYPIDLNVRTRYFEDDPKKGMKDRKLSRDELDAYYLEHGELDLEELINDLVQTALPTYVSEDDEDAPECPHCASEGLRGERHSDPSKPVAGTAKESPFAALKGLKLKQ